MSPRVNAIVMFVAATLIAALATAWHQRHSRRELESSLAIMAQKRSADDTTRQSFEDRLHLAENGRARFQATLAKSQIPSAESAGSARPSTAHPLDILHRDPAAQILWLASRRAAVAVSYGPLFRSLALTPEQVETFQTLTIRREEQAMDLTAIVRQQGLGYDDPSVAALREKADDEERAARLALLGPEGYHRLQEYLRTLPVREIVDALAGVAAVSGMPFSAEQSARLTQRLASASSRYQSGGAADIESIDWDAADRLAQAILSPEQFVLYETVEPEGRGGRFSGRVTQALARTRTESPPKPR